MEVQPPPSVRGQLTDWRRRESLLLAPYAMQGSQSKGRKYPEADHPYRSPYQRDRDRIVHCSAFRRLSGKMQVFAGDRGDYHRTRLTHTHEVASIARTIGRTLQLNEDLIESLALVHDIGHPPYGHSGEEVLQRLLADEGGFTHNRHALVIVEELESRNSDHPGLNLTREVLQGQFARTGQASGRLLEAQVVDAADSIAYNAHDVDDGVKLGLLDLEEIAETPLVQQAYLRAIEEISLDDHRRLRKAVAYNLVDMMVQDLLENAGAELVQKEFRSPTDASRSSFRLQQSQAILPQKTAMQRWLFDRLYRHPQLVQMRREVAQRMETMFNGYVKKPELMLERFRRRVDVVGRRRTAGEYLAGMTERFCEQCAERDFGLKC